MTQRLLFNGSAKKGPMVWAFSILMPGRRCPFASPVCSRLCYADAGKFPLHDKAYARNFEATRQPDFAGRVRRELEKIAWQHSGRRIACCVHEKGELYGLDYVRAWGRIIRQMRAYSNVSFFFYTRSWVSPEFRAELERIAAGNGNVRINLSLDGSMVRERGVPERIGSGLVAYLAETDDDLPPAGVDLVFRNLRIQDHTPMERLGGCLVCPNESGMFVAKEGGVPVLKGGRTIRVRCQDCRLCIDRGLLEWERAKGRLAGTPGAPLRDCPGNGLEAAQAG